jgi:hypothetical protein
MLSESFSCAFGGYNYDYNGQRQLGGGYDYRGNRAPIEPSVPAYQHSYGDDSNSRRPVELPASVITRGVPPTPQQMQNRKKPAKITRDALTTSPLVKAAQEGNLPQVKRICRAAPKGKQPDYNYIAASVAAEAGHHEIVAYLVYEQPVCSYLKKEGFDAICYNFFWQSIWSGDRPLFDFFIGRGIDVHRISKSTWKVSDEGKIFYRNVHVNAVNFLRAGYHMYGESEDLEYMKDILESHGLTTTPPLNYDGDSCCNVQ